MAKTGSSRGELSHSEPGAVEARCIESPELAPEPPASNLSGQGWTERTVIAQ